MEINQEELTLKYQEMNSVEFKQEFERIISIPEARTNIEALTQMSILMKEMEARGIKLPKAQRQNIQDEGGVSVGSLIFGLVLLFGGIALTMSGNSIYYGAIIVGLITIVKAIAN